MVLYKRKRVTYIRPPPVPENLDTEIFVIPHTKEWFLTYENYLARTDYYNRRKFVCEITGNLCLTYYEAHASEKKEIQDLETNFPEALREHVLKFLQFNRISRLDLLVDKVYLVFKNEYFPGEEVFVKKLVSPATDKASPRTARNQGPTPITIQPYFSTVKHKGVIREKVQYSNNPSDTNYLVATAQDNAQIIATNQQISRDRNHFTKWLVKTYVKLTVTRSHKVGAPWVVKEKYAQKYRIPQEFPEDLKQFEHLTPSGEISFENGDQQISPSPGLDVPQVPKVKKPRGRAALKIKAALKAAQEAEALSGIKHEGAVLVADGTTGAKQKEKPETRLRFPVHHLPAHIRQLLDQNDQATTSLFQPSKKTIIEDLQLAFDLQNRRPTPAKMQLPANARRLNMQIAEQLQDDLAELREQPPLDKLDEETRRTILEIEAEVHALLHPELSSMQEALEAWIFLNIYHSVLKLDTFTFDDFVCAMGWNAEQLQTEGRCELLDEIWCAVLGLVVSNDPAPTTQSAAAATDDVRIPGLQITLPPNMSRLQKPANGVKKEEPEEDDAANNNDGDIDYKWSNDEQESRPLKIEDYISENEADISGGDRELDEENDKKMNEEEDDEVGHSAYTVMTYRGVKWHERLRKRNFKDGLWLTVLLGVLSLVEYVPEYSATISKVFRTLAPAHASPATPASVLMQFYTCMSIDLRMQVLHILTSLVVNGTAVRTYIDESLDASATLRRNRLDILRDWKAHVDTANKVHSEIFSKLMEECAKSLDPKLWSAFSRKRHRLNTKGYEMTEYEMAVAATDPSFTKLWEAREMAINNINETRASKKDVEMQLSQLDCQRVRLLGKDRHYNRYWWFENNGLPNIHYAGGVEDDEDQQQQQQLESDDEMDDNKDDFQTETYLMGCLWVQGPSATDALTHVKVPKEEADRIVRALDDGEEYSYNGGGTSFSNGRNITGNATGVLSEMNFGSLPPAVVAGASKNGLNFTQNSVTFKDSGAEIIDWCGGLPADFDVRVLSAVQRKYIEELHSPLFSARQWRFFDKPEDVDSLIKWLNPWGKRELLLRKETLRVREGMTASIEARRKALRLDKLAKEEAELEANLEAVEAKIEKFKNGNVEELELEGSEEDDTSTTRKRPNRRGANGPNKRQKTAEETIKAGSVADLEKLHEKLKKTLEAKVSENLVTRVSEWVNRTARDEFHKSLYEGGDKSRSRGRKTKK